MKNSATMKIEMKNEAEISANLKVEGQLKMKLKSLVVATALGAAVLTASLP